MPPTWHICGTTNQVALARTSAVKMKGTHKAPIYPDLSQSAGERFLFLISLPEIKLLRFGRELQ